MRQRNPGPYTIDIPTIDPPVRLLPGEEINYPEQLAGLELVDPPKTKSKENKGPDSDGSSDNDAKGA